MVDLDEKVESSRRMSGRSKKAVSHTIYEKKEPAKTSSKQSKQSIAKQKKATTTTS